MSMSAVIQSLNQSCSCGVSAQRAKRFCFFNSVKKSVITRPLYIHKFFYFLMRLVCNVLKHEFIYQQRALKTVEK